jgi:hypothetical protein
VVANRPDPTWQNVLRGVDSQFITVSIFTRRDGAIARETDGSLNVTDVNLGFYKYSATLRSIRISRPCDLPEGIIQMEDPYGFIGLWTVTGTSDSLWVTKNGGDPGLPDNCWLQILRTQTGKITLRPPRTNT